MVGHLSCFPTLDLEWRRPHGQNTDEAEHCVHSAGQRGLGRFRCIRRNEIFVSGEKSVERTLCSIAQY